MLILDNAKLLQQLLRAALHGVAGLAYCGLAAEADHLACVGAALCYGSINSIVIALGKRCAGSAAAAPRVREAALARSADTTMQPPRPTPSEKRADGRRAIGGARAQRCLERGDASDAYRYGTVSIS